MTEITNLLKEAREKIGQASNLITKVEVTRKVGEDYIINPEFEEALAGIYEIDEALANITTGRVAKGTLDVLKDYVKDQLVKFFQENYKQKKYEGDLVEVGYRVTRRRSVTEDVAPEFIEIKKVPNTKAINEYIKATKSDSNPDGLLPKGVVENSFEYISYKTIKDGEN